GLEAPAREPPRPDVDRARPHRAALGRADRDLRGAAADVADCDRLPADPAGPRDGAEEREPSLLRGRDQPDRTAPPPRAPLEQLLAVRGLAAGARDEHLDPLRAALPRHGDEAGHDVGGLGQLPVGDGARTLDRCAEREHRSALLDRLAAARDEQADPVRPPVDDADSHAPMMKGPQVGTHLPRVDHRARSRRRMKTSCAERLRSLLSCVTRSHAPSGPSSQAWELSARSALKIDSMSPRTWADSTGTTTSMRWSRFRAMRSALPSR